MSDEQQAMEQRAREWIVANRHEPLACTYCGHNMPQGTFTITPYSDHCAKSPSGNHSYLIPIGGDPEEAEAKRMVAFALAEVRRLQQGWVSVEERLPESGSAVFAAVWWVNKENPAASRYEIHDCLYCEGGSGSGQKFFADCEGEEFEHVDVAFWIYKRDLAARLPAPPEAQPAPDYNCVICGVPMREWTLKPSAEHVHTHEDGIHETKLQFCECSVPDDEDGAYCSLCRMLKAKPAEEQRGAEPRCPTEEHWREIEQRLWRSAMDDYKLNHNSFGFNLRDAFAQFFPSPARVVDVQVVTQKILNIMGNSSIYEVGPAIESLLRSALKGGGE